MTRMIFADRNSKHFDFYGQCNMHVWGLGLSIKATRRWVNITLIIGPFEFYACVVICQ